MSEDIKHFIKQCVHCIKCKYSHKSKVPLGSFPKVNEPFQRWHIDLLGPLPTSINKKKFIFVAVDAFSNFCILESLSSKSTDNIRNIFINKIVKSYGKPKYVITDLGKEFNSKSFRNYCNENDIKLHLCAPYHHASNGLVERFNLQIENAIRCMIDENKGGWAVHLKKIEESFNTTISRGTRLSPYEIINNCRAPIKLIGIKNNSGKLFRDNIILNNFVNKCLNKNSNNMKQRYNSNKKFIKFNVGDEVYIKDFNRSNKLKPIYVGPFKVENVEESNYSYIVSNDYKSFRVHVNNIKY